jgi:hypothetical protein
MGVADFGLTSQFRVVVQNSGKTVAIGDHTDAAFRNTPTLITPGAAAVDVVIHGLPGRFIEKLGGSREIPVSVLAQLLESAGLQRGTPLRLLTCHAGEAPLKGEPAAQQLATEWGGPVTAPNGLLRIGTGQLRIDLVDWDPDPVLGGMSPSVIGQGQGTWISYTP